MLLKDNRNVVCKDDLTPELISEIKKGLIEEGYDLGINGDNSVVDDALNEALVSY